MPPLRRSFASAMGSFLSNRAIEGGQQKRLRGEDARKEGAMSAAQREEALRHQAICVVATTVSGHTFAAKVLPGDNVRQLKACLAELSGIPAYQQRLLLDTRLLKDAEVLETVGVLDGCEFTLVIGPKVPEWAAKLGLDGEHPALLRGYFKQHASSDQLPDWLEDDDQCWEKLEKSREVNAQRMADLQGWNHQVELMVDDLPARIIRVTPGQAVKLQAAVRIQNNQADSCIHQLLLALDTTIVAALYDGVPGRGRRTAANVTFDAPNDPRVYMLWRSNDLQYSMANARQNFENSVRKPMPEKYPDSFVGWLVVEA